MYHNNKLLKIELEMNNFLKNLKQSYEAFSKEQKGKDVPVVKAQFPEILFKVRIYLTKYFKANCSHCCNAKVIEAI